MTPTNIERRRNDQERWDKISTFMSRIDQRNIDKDLNYAVQEESCLKCQERLSVLEHKATRMETLGMTVPAVGSVAWLAFKIGQALHIKI